MFWYNALYYTEMCVWYNGAQVASWYSVKFRVKTSICFRYSALQVAGWYRNARGVNWTLWPLDLITYWWRTRSFQDKEYFLSY